MRITFTIPGDIVPWARAGKRGKIQFTPTRQRNFMGVIRGGAHDAMDGRKPLDGPVALKVVAVYAWPQSTTKKRRADPAGAWKTTKPDDDNIGKIVRDCLNGIAFVDDAQVSQSASWKVFGERPGLRVSVESLQGTPAPVF